MPAENVSAQFLPINLNIIRPIWVEWQQDKLLALGQARIVRLRRESALLLSASALRDDG